MKTYYGILLAATGCASWAYMGLGDQGLNFQNEGPDKSEILLVAYGYVMTVFGVLLGSTYRTLDRMRDAGQTQIGDFLVFGRDIIRSVDLWMALLASPIVYAALWKTIENQAWASLTIFPLENGFACLALISAIIRRQQKI